MSDLIDRILFFGYFPVEIDLREVTEQDVKDLNESSRVRFAHILYEHLQGCSVPEHTTVRILFGRNDLYRNSLCLGIYLDDGAVSIYYI